MSMTIRDMVALAVTLVSLAACSGTTPTTTTTGPPPTTAPGSSVATTTSATSTQPPTTTTTVEATTTTVENVVVIDLIVEGGEVDGPGDVEVATGSDVLIRVTSDVSDEIHLHGYDISVDVEAGDTAELPFTADREGIFEVELEDARLQLLEITVR